MGTFDNPQRKGSAGRIPDSRYGNYQPFVRRNVTLPPELDERLQKYAQDEERALSWCMQKAIDEWLKSKGY